MRPAWAPPRRPARESVTVTPTVVIAVTAVTAVTAVRVQASPAGSALAGLVPPAVVLAARVPVVLAGPVRTPTAARVLAVRVPVVRVLAR